MKLLISAYACAPNLGSEHAVGWNWTTEAHRQGYQVWALASPAHREAIENACRDDPALRGIHWGFPDIGVWPVRPGHGTQMGTDLQFIMAKGGAALRPRTAARDQIRRHPPPDLGRHPRPDISRVAWAALDYRPDRRGRDIPALAS